MAGPQTTSNLRQNRLSAGRSLRSASKQQKLSTKGAQQPGRSKLRLFSAADRLVVAAGVLTAVASASFATYMASTDHPHPMFGGIEHLMIFAQPSSGNPHALIARVPKATDDQGIDFTATGSIPGKPKDDPRPIYTLPALNARVEPVIKGFALRGVSGNVAMVEGVNGIYRVEPGSILPGAGRVLSIQWRKGKFVVVTTEGIIGEQEP
jgi:hypothetical protein